MADLLSFQPPTRRPPGELAAAPETPNSARSRSASSPSSARLLRLGTHVLVAVAVVSLPTALAGFWDWWKSTEPGTQAWRTANWHMAVMVTVTVLVANIIVHLARWGEGDTPPLPLLLSLLVGTLTAYGAIDRQGGVLVYEYGFNVETSGDHPAWHKSEVDVGAGEH